MSIRPLPAFLIAIFLVANAVSAHAQRTTILVNAFGNETGDRNFDWIGEGLAIGIADRLMSQRELYVFGRDERTAEYERLGLPEPLSVSRATSIRMAWDLGADVLVTGRYSTDGDRLRIEARILNLAENSIDLDLSVTGKPEDILSMAESLASRLSMALVPGSVVTSSPIPPKAFEAYVRGIQSIDSQRRVNLLQEAIRLHPQYTSAVYQLGLMRYLDTDYEESTRMLDRIPSQVPEYAMARFMIGMNAYRLDQYSKAAAIYSTLEPSYDIFVNLGASLASGTDPGAAAPILQRALERNPSGAEAAFDLAYVAFMRGDWGTAATRLTQYLQSHGGDSEVVYLLGQTYAKLGRTEQAQQLMAQATRQSPSLARWTSQGIPNLLRVRTQFDATELRLPGGVWNEARKERKAATP